jgi:ABC-2 type transport system ATP-binding protein
MIPSTTLNDAERRRPGTRSSDPILRGEGLAKHFPVRRSWAELLRHPFRREYTSALRGVTFEVGAGEFFGLLGPNGAGKTTLFKILSTLILPDSGTAVIAGSDIVRDPAVVRRNLTPVIADERSLHWRLSARENLRLFASLHGLRGRTAEGRVQELLQVVDLGDTGEKLVGAFSSGMKQRLLIARALLSRPRVLLLDEPTRSLDPISARGFRRFLREEIAGHQGCSVLLATHSAEEALDLCDRLAVLHQGELLALGPAEELARRFGDERYRLWLREDERWSPALLENQPGLRLIELHSDNGSGDGWARVYIEVRGGRDRTAAVLAELSSAGVAVAGLERLDLTLADLLERIVMQGAGGANV